MINIGYCAIYILTFLHVTRKYHNFWIFKLFIYIDDEFTVHETDCSVKCGKGTKTVTIVHCSENQNHEVECKSIPEKKQIPCDTQIECPTKYHYSQWGSWTQCSRHSTYIRTVSSHSLSAFCLLCWTGLNCFIGHLSRVTCTIHSISAMTSQKGIECTKTRRKAKVLLS